MRARAPIRGAVSAALAISAAVLASGSLVSGCDEPNEPNAIGPEDFRRDGDDRAAPEPAPPRDDSDRAEARRPDHVGRD